MLMERATRTPGFEPNMFPGLSQFVAIVRSENFR